MCVTLLRIFTGGMALLAYTASIFKESGSSLSPNLSSIIVAIVQIFGNVCSIFLVERAGRKLLFTISYFGCAFGLAVLGTFSYLKNTGVEFILDPRLQWIPLVSFSFVIFISNCGFMAITFLYIAELSPQKVLPYITTACLLIGWTLGFVLVKVSLGKSGGMSLKSSSLYLEYGSNDDELGTAWNPHRVWWNRNSWRSSSFTHLP